MGLFETNNNGMATIKVDLPTEATTINYKLIEKVAPNGYIIDRTEKTVSIEFENNSGVIVVKSINVDGTNVRVGSNDAISANIVFENELVPPIEETTTFEFIINKKDSKDLTKNILKENTIFIVTGPDGTPNTLRTDASGKVVMSCNMPKVAGTYTYEIEEIKAPTGYTLYGTTQYVDIVFENIDGIMRITSASVRGDKINKDFAGINSTNDNEVMVSVLNDKNVPVVDEKFTLNINKVDEELNNILQQNVYFKLETEGEDAKLIATNVSGLATFIGTIPKEAKTIVYKLTEITAPEGYIKNANEMTLNLIFTEVSGKIKLTDITINEEQGVRKIGNVQNNTAGIQVINKEKLEQPNFTLEINKQDKETKVNIYEQGIGFEIVKPDGTNAYVETNEMGIATYIGICPEEAGTYTYKIKEIKAPEGYIKNANEMNVTLTFSEDSGNMQLSNISVVVSEGIRQISNVTGNVAKVAVDNQKEVGAQPKEKYALKINKVDENGANILQAGVVFKVIDILGNVSYIETNDKGVATASFEMPETEGTHILKVIEVSGPTGYIKNSNEMTIQVISREISGKMNLINIVVDEEQQIQKVGTVQNNLMELNVINQKEHKEEPVKDKFTLGIKKIDAETLEYIKQAGIIFKVEDSTSKYDFYGTNNEGIATASFEIPDSAGTYTYYIAETVAPTGYDKNPNKIAVNATFVESNGKIILSKFEVQNEAGARIIENVTDGHIGYVEVLNSKTKEEPTKETWAIELDKVDSQTLERIKQAGVVFKIVNEEGKPSYLETDTEGKIILTNFVPEASGTIRYEIEEITAPDGYKLFENSQYLDITFGEVNGKIVITNAQVSGDKITNIYGTKKVTVSVLNDKLEDIPDNPETPDKPDIPNKTEDKKFDLSSEKHITNVTIKYNDTNEVENRKISNKDSITKLDVKENRLKYLELTLEYKIVVTNVGNKEGTLESIVDRIPNGLYMNLNENKGWSLYNNVATYSLKDTILQPGETKEVTIVLHYNGSSEITGQFINYASFEAKDEVDGDDIENNNNLAKATFILSIKTGQEIIIYPILTFSALAIIGLGVVGIKKYVL